MHRIEIPTESLPRLGVPVEFGGLRALAYNLWWTWSREARHLFRRIDPALWDRYHNPIELLLEVPPGRWDELHDDSSFSQHCKAVLGDLRRYLAPDAPTWFGETHATYDGGPIAYFSTEYGWHDSLGVYSGGLGVLSGDHCKSASDEGVPFVGIGLMYRRGYFSQTVDPGGNQQHFYPDFDVRRLPMTRVTTPDGRSPLSVEIPWNGDPVETVHAHVWKVQVGRVPVLLLDTDIDANPPAVRPITSILYVQGREMRLCQEMVLGSGGVRALHALGIEPSAWHMNEGHSALLAFERFRGVIARDGVTLAEARDRVAPNVVFTTHTPVPAGNETFDRDLVRRHFGGFARDCGVDVDDLLALGDDGRGDGDAFNMTALALRSSHAANGVSELHGRVADGLWRHLVPGAGPGGAIGSVTNGVHTSTWIGPHVESLLEEHVGADWEVRMADPRFAATVETIPGDALWRAHRGQKDRLVAYARRQLREQSARHGRAPGELGEVDRWLDPDVLTIGFARRFATYKRAALLFHDLDRLRTIVGDDDRPVQLVFAGKAHPADRPGQELIRTIVETGATEGLRGRVVFLENYNMRIAQFLVQGVDVWLNTPRRPHEASGTSGMKAALNGALNVSVLDGWWCEGYDVDLGWAIGDETLADDTATQDTNDAASLYDVLEHFVVPEFYTRDEDDRPSAWIARMKRSIGRLGPRFSTSRMLREYTDRYYLPACARSAAPVRR